MKTAGTILFALGFPRVAMIIVALAIALPLTLAPTIAFGTAILLLCLGAPKLRPLPHKQLPAPPQWRAFSVLLTTLKQLWLFGVLLLVLTLIVFAVSIDRTAALFRRKSSFLPKTTGNIAAAGGCMCCRLS